MTTITDLIKVVDAATITCGKKHWDIDSFENAKKVLAKHMEKARICRDFLED